MNPIMGCGGCELFPVSPKEIFKKIDQRLKSSGVENWEPDMARQLFQELLNEAWDALLGSISGPQDVHHNRLTTTNVYHLLELAKERVSREFGKAAGTLLRDTVQQHVTCYAASSHLNRGYAITRPERNVNIGYAPTFEQVTRFAGRMQAAAKWSDLTGTDRSLFPWLNGLPRLIFVSDMGDAYSSKRDFDFLQQETEVFQSASPENVVPAW